MPKKKPRYMDASLSEAQLVVLGVAAPLLAMNDLPATRFGGYRLGEPSATHQLAGLSMLPSAAGQKRVEQALARGVREQPAWTLGRAAAWASFAYAARAFDASLAWGYMLTAARAVQAAHTGWEDFAEAYATARVAWRGASGEPEGYEAKVFAKLLKDPESPWLRARFTTSLAAVPPPVVSVPEAKRVADSAELRVALATAQPGDHVLLAAGEYTGPFELDTDVSLSTTRAHKAVLTGLVSVDDAGVLLDGLVFSDGGLVAQRGAVVHARRCRIHGGRVGMVATGKDTHLFASDVRVDAPTEYGVIIDKSAYAELERVRVRGGEHSAVSIEGKATAHVRECDVASAGEAGLHVHAATATVTGGRFVNSGQSALLARAKARVVVTGTCFERTQQSLVAVRGGSDVTLNDCTLRRAAVAGIDVADTGSRLSARKCSVNDARSSGAIVAKGHISLSDCRITGASYDAVTVRDGGRVAVQGGVLTDVRGAGVSVAATARANVRGTTIRDVDRGVRVEAEGRAGLHGVRVCARDTAVTVLGALAMLETTLEGASRLQLEVIGGRVSAVRTRFTDAADTAIATAGDARVSLHECQVKGGELSILAEDKSLVRASHTELSDFTLAAVSAQPGEVHLEHCVVRGGGNGVEAVGGRVVLRDSWVDANETAASAEDVGRIEVHGGSITAGTGFACEAESAATVRVTDAQVSPGEHGLTRGDVLITPASKGDPKKRGAERKPAEPAPLPFDVSLWEDQFSVVISDPWTVLAPSGDVLGDPEYANGHRLGGLVERIAAAESLEGVHTDPEADSCTILCADYAVLRRVLTSLNEAVRDHERLRPLVAKKR